MDSGVLRSDDVNWVDGDRGLSSPSQVKPAMSGQEGGQTTGSQGFDNPAFDQQQQQDGKPPPSYGEQGADKTAINGNVPPPAAYSNGGKLINSL